jgi:hypothetical protein
MSEHEMIEHEEMIVDAVAVAPLVELVRLFSEVVDERPLAPEAIVVAQATDDPARILVPAYLGPMVRDVAALCVRERPGALRPSEISSSLFELVGLIGDLWVSAPDIELPALETLFVQTGIPIQRPALP